MLVAATASVASVVLTALDSMYAFDVLLRIAHDSANCCVEAGT